MRSVAARYLQRNSLLSYFGLIACVRSSVWRAFHLSSYMCRRCQHGNPFSLKNRSPIYSTNGKWWLPKKCLCAKKNNISNNGRKRLKQRVRMSDSHTQRESARYDRKPILISFHFDWWHNSVSIHVCLSSRHVSILTQHKVTKIIFNFNANQHKLATV